MSGRQATRKSPRILAIAAALCALAAAGCQDRSQAELDHDEVRKIASQAGSSCTQVRKTVCDEVVGACHEEVESDCADGNGNSAQSILVFAPGDDDSAAKLETYKIDNKTFTYCYGRRPLLDPLGSEPVPDLTPQLQYLKNQSSAHGLTVQWRKGTGTQGSTDRCFGYQRNSKFHSSNSSTEKVTDLVVYDGQNLQNGSSVCGTCSGCQGFASTSINNGTIIGSVICIDENQILKWANTFRLSFAKLVRHSWCHEMAHALGIAHAPNGAATCAQGNIPDRSANIYSTYSSTELAELKSVATNNAEK